jgi:hypothetical protein
MNAAIKEKWEPVLAVLGSVDLSWGGPPLPPPQEVSSESGVVKRRAGGCFRRSWLTDWNRRHGAVYRPTVDEAFRSHLL